MPPPIDTEAGEAPDLLSAVESRAAGGRIIRGSAARGAGYLFGTGATAGAFALLLRHLGVGDFGRFSTVIALVTVAAGLAEAGLQTIGQRVYAVAAGEPERRAVLAKLLGIRLVATPLAVLAAATFALFAGYGATMVWGTLIAGAGAVLVVLAGTISLRLVQQLRYVALTFVETARQLVIVAAIVALTVAGASLGAFFTAYLIAGVATAVLTVLVLGRHHIVAPDLRWREWLPILRETGPLAVSLALNVFYLKLLIVFASLVVSDHEVGVFATASRVTEVLIGLPAFMVGAALPLLAHAGARDEERLAYAMQRLAEAALLIGALFAAVLVVAAEPIVDVFAGPGYEDAIPVLRVQAFVLVGASLTQTWLLGVIAVEAQRSLIAVNALALVSVAALGGLLVPPFGAMGASIAAVSGETLMALATLTALVRARPALRPSATGPPKVGAALALALACALLPLPPALRGGVAAVAFVAAAAALRAIPVEIVHAFGRRERTRIDSPGGA